jgi:putative glutamine amidotransferase
MSQPPLILVSPDIEQKGKEFGDLSSSLSANYERALMAAGGLPMTMPTSTSQAVLAECVRRCDGVLLTGGDDVDPRLYVNGLPAGVRRTVSVTADGGQRDLREMLVIDEAFRRQKPLLAICRGHQVLNVALGGTLIADIPSQVKGALNHRQMDKRSQPVHKVQLTPGSLLRTIAGRTTLDVNSTHHQAVGRVAPALTVSARSVDGVIEGLELKVFSARGLPFLLSVQFHPERLADRYAEHRAVFDAFVQACTR